MVDTARQPDKQRSFLLLCTTSFGCAASLFACVVYYEMVMSSWLQAIVSREVAKAPIDSRLAKDLTADLKAVVAKHNFPAVRGFESSS